MKSNIDGKIGEAQAAHFLKNLGYEILQTNYKNYIGEIDIVALDKTTLVFVEVKERASAKFGYPREAVNYQKQNKIRLVAEVFLQKFRREYSSVRFDVVEILSGDITHIKDAF